MCPMLNRPARGLGLATALAVALAFASAIPAAAQEPGVLEPLPALRLLPVASGFIRPAHVTTRATAAIDPLDPDLADEASEEPLLLLNQPYADHNNGTLLFGADRMLYAGFGDGG